MSAVCVQCSEDLGDMARLVAHWHVSGHGPRTIQQAGLDRARESLGIEASAFGTITRSHVEGGVEVIDEMDLGSVVVRDATVQRRRAKLTSHRGGRR